MERLVTLNKTGFEPFFDFIKAYAILCVLMGHTFPYLDQTGYSLWYGMQVPMFLLIQVFHSLKKDNPSFNIKKCAERVLYPFLLIQGAIIIACILFTQIDYKDFAVSLITHGGTGPGAYYPWIYIQFAILLPLIRQGLNKGTKIKQVLIAIIICESIEIISSLIGLPYFIHRILAFRYIFLIYLGWLWVKDGILINKTTLALSLLSMGAIVYFEYFYTPTEPWFYDTTWKTHRWPCYFYVSNLLCYVLYILYNKTKYYIDKPVKMLAKCSYEIFLIQMAVIPLFNELSFLGNKYASCGLRIFCVFVISIIGGYYFHILYNKFLQRLKQNRNVTI